MPSSKEIGIRLIKLRGNRTQEQVSNCLGITFQALSNYEKGIRTPRDETKKKIADFYDVSVQSIFFD